MIHGTLNPKEFEQKTPETLEENAVSDNAFLHLSNNTTKDLSRSAECFLELKKLCNPISSQRCSSSNRDAVKGEWLQMKEETVFSVLQQLRKLNSSASFKWVSTHFEPSKNPSLQVPSTAFKKEH